MSSSTVTGAITTIYDIPDELLRLISISAGPTEYCNFRRASKRLWLTTTSREDHCIKHFLVTEVDRLGYTRTTLCGKYHSMFDQPAIISPNGEKSWYQHGDLHRDNDQPAIIYIDGTNRWYQHGKRHRNNDLPAVVYSFGKQLWYQRDKLHRDGDQPAEIYANGTKYWYKHGIKYTP